MKPKRYFFDYKTILSYTSLLFTFVIFNSIEAVNVPYSIAIYVSALAQNASLILTSVLFVFSFLVTGGQGMLLSSAISAVTLIIITLIYKKFKIKPNFEYSLFAIISLIGYIFIGDTQNQVLLEKRLLSVILISFLSLLCLISSKAIVEKNLKIKFSVEEYSALSAVVCIFGLGVSNFISPYLWKCVSVFIIIFCCYLFKAGIGITVSAILGIGLALYYGNVNYVSAFLVIGIVAQTIMPLSRFLSALALPIVDFLSQYLFGIYSAYRLIDFLSILIGCIAFIVIPSKPLKILKDNLYAFREKQLIRQAINRNRTMLSNKLYELSTVFLEMANAFNDLNKKEISPEKSKENINARIENSVCKQCEYYYNCLDKMPNKEHNMVKMIDIGFAKGKLSLIDLPKDFADYCLRPKEIIYGINKLLADYRNYLIEKSNIANGRKMIADEVFGVSEILKSLALESGTLLKYQSKLERTLSENLFKSGILVNELLIYGENDRLCVSIVVAQKEIIISNIESIISKTLKTRLSLCDKCQISDEKIYLSFSKSAEYDVVFGISKQTKDNSKISGDTHSVTRLSNDRFLIALSDGMGSGIEAEKVSNTSLSLIESFYKADMKSPLILNTVNKLLSINTEDTFSALDISVIDLKTCKADFIKFGSPYGFIINQNGIRIIEGNALPLGILDDLKPFVCEASLNENDVILLITDGVSDAFGSSSEIIDFLRSVPAKNPQTLADSIIEKALSYSGGLKKDDMTAVALRIYKKSSLIN